MRARLAALLALSLTWGCGDETGILISVTEDGSLQSTVTKLRFTVGVQDPNDPTLYIADSFELATDEADVVARDLQNNPYELLLRDGGPFEGPSTIVVAVVAYDNDVPVAYAGMPSAQTFMSGKVVKHTLSLVDGTLGGDFDVFDTGCVRWGNQTIAGRDDLNCDGCNDTDGSGARCVKECDTPADCQTALGDPRCGAYECNNFKCEVVCPDCTDADLDGYGVGDGCAGADCDDDDDQVGDVASRACYTGPAGTEDKGSCRPGTETCVGGNWNTCSGEITPAGEACNNEDDDCDDQVDEELGDVTCGVGQCVNTTAACVGGVLTTPSMCTPGASAIDDSMCNGLDDDCDGQIDEDCPNGGCVLVSPTGDDTVAGNDVTGLAAFATIQAAINWAAADGNRPRNVCVSSGATCGLVASYNGAITMQDGINLIGGYNNVRGRCTGSTVVINTGTSTGIKFPSGVTSSTVLDGFKINRFAASETAGITVEGSKNVVIRNVEIANQVTATSSYGVRLESGAEALITNSDIWGGNGSMVTAGIYSKDSTPTIRGNCPRFDAQGRCNQWCQNNGPAIRGRYGGTNGAGAAFGVLLQNSPGATIESSAVCGNGGATGAAVRITGNGAGTVVRSSFVAGFGGVTDSHGIWLTDCADSAPWIVDNHTILGEGNVVTTRVNAIRSVGKCHPVVDSNQWIAGGNEGGTVGTIGVYCGQDANGNPSRCTVINNPRIEGSIVGFPPFAIGVRCDDGGCVRISGNHITGRGGLDSVGLSLGNTGPVVDNNEIKGGCAENTAVGVQADGSFARLENNRIFGGNCNIGSVAAGNFIGLYSKVADSPNQLDVHSNSIDGDGNGSGCFGAGVIMQVGASTPLAGSGIYRNNIILAGRCGTAISFDEKDASADPQVFENNDLDHAGASSLYRDENTTNLSDISEVNALTDMITSNNISQSPAFVSYPTNLHLTAGSLCIAAGTPTGAPPLDMDGDPRDPATPDIGPDEF